MIHIEDGDKMIYQFIIAMIAGIGAGVATGFAGLSAAAIISPLLIGLLHMPVYSAVGISLASDVLASAAAALTYRKNGNMDMKKSRILFIFVVGFAILGSLVSAFVTDFEIGNSAMSIWMVICSILLGLNFVIRAGKEKQRSADRWLGFSKVVISVACGGYIGFVCGFQGTGGGLMMLFVLNILLGIEFKKAVGSSVLIMTFTALIGAGTHFYLRGWPDLYVLVVCIVFTYIAAKISAVAANRMKEVVVKRITGVLLTASGVILFAGMIL